MELTAEDVLVTRTPKAGLVVASDGPVVVGLETAFPVLYTGLVKTGVMTLQALDNWSERVAGHVPSEPVEMFYAEHFNDEYMASRFQSMAIDPKKSARA